MNRPVEFKTRPQLALESYLDALLQDATAEELPEPILVLEPAVEPESPLDEFQQAVMEEQTRDAQGVEVPVVVPSAPAVVAPPVVEPLVDV
ncbi:MAG: chemotaxis protein CheW, partial [Pseudomonas paracarnis]